MSAGIVARCRLIPIILVLFAVSVAAEIPPAPEIEKVSDRAGSHAFLAAAHQQHPFDLVAHGYVEEEFLVSGRARVFDWGKSDEPLILGEGPYTTRILVRRPQSGARFNGTVIVEPLNPSSPVDAPIMWAESYEHFIAEGYAWVGITIKPNTIQALKRFDPVRYAGVSMPALGNMTRCAAEKINASSQPTTVDDETGLAWDILSQIGALLKDPSSRNPLGKAATRLYMTGQSQTAGYARTYATVFGKRLRDPDGGPLFDAYLYSGSPPWQVPLNQCRADLERGDPRLITPAVGVPVIELFAQGDIGTNVETRRPDADTRADRFRRYEIAGAPHVDPWELRSFASDADMRRATGDAAQAGDAGCTPRDVHASDFPTRYAFNAAWSNLDRWVRRGIAPPQASPLQLRPGREGPFLPDQAFVEDEYGNAKGGVRSPAVDVPTARWVGAKAGGFRCMFEGYKYPFDDKKMVEMYGGKKGYLKAVKRSVAELKRQRWLTSRDADEIMRNARQVSSEPPRLP